MIDMGVEPFLVASTVEGVMAQRLVRRLCPQCKEAYTPAEAEIPADFPKDKLKEIGGKLYRNRGCRACRNVGFAGRMGIYELLITSERIRKLAHDRASTWDITRAGLEEGMTTLRKDGWRKVLAGKTTIDEIARTTKGDIVHK
jgi:general secretion pathway protein E/type IV pilus assembly protein PilB